MKFWAYLTDENKIKVKRFWGKDSETEKEKAFEDEKVLQIMHEFEAQRGWPEAERKAKEFFKNE